MKRVVRSLLLVVLLLVPFIKVEALSVSKNDIVIAKGNSEKIELYANVSDSVKEVSFSLVYSTYDITANFTADTKFSNVSLDGVKYTIHFDKNETGKILLGTVDITVSKTSMDTSGTINIHNASAVSDDGKSITLNNQNINVKVGTQEDVDSHQSDSSGTMLLDRIESKIVKIDLKKDVFEYDVVIDDDIDELDLKPIASDKECDIDITTQKISELEDDRITITAKRGSVTEKYIIHVKINDKKNIEIDKGEFVEDKSYKKKWLVIIIGLNAILLFSLVFIKIKRNG